MSKRSLPLNGLQTFLVTARHLNLTHAATELCITQGAVSRQIQTLEAWFGFPLFNRHARGLTLTPRAEQLLPELTQLLEKLHRLTEQVRLSPEQIRLKAPSCAMRWLVPRLVSFEQHYPQFHVALTTTLDHRRQLEDFDAAVIYGAVDSPGEKLFDEEITPVLAGHLTAPENYQQLQNYTFLHPTRDMSDWQLWLNKQAAPPEMIRNQHFETMDLAINAAAQGFGITVADINLAAPEIAQGRLIAPFHQTAKTGASYRLLHRTTTVKDEALKTLIHWLHQPVKPTANGK